MILQSFTQSNHCEHGIKIPCSRRNRLIPIVFVSCIRTDNCFISIYAPTSFSFHSLKWTIGWATIRSNLIKTTQNSRLAFSTTNSATRENTTSMTVENLQPQRPLTVHMTKWLGYILCIRRSIQDMAHFSKWLKSLIPCDRFCAPHESTLPPRFCVPVSEFSPNSLALLAQQATAWDQK